MSVLVRTVGLLILSNVFMTFAGYAHLRNRNDRKWYVAALRLDYLWAGCCIMGAVYFVFRSHS